MEFPRLPRMEGGTAYEYKDYEDRHYNGST